MALTKTTVRDLGKRTLDVARAGAVRLAVAAKQRTVAAGRAFVQPGLIEKRTGAEERRANIVLALDWGEDGAQTNIESEIESITSALGVNATVNTIPGIPVLGSSLSCAVEFERLIDTHRISCELAVRVLESRGYKPEQIQEKLEAMNSLVLVNVFDRTVGSDRIAGIASGTISICNGRYSVPAQLIGPLNNGIIGKVAEKLGDVEVRDLSNTNYHADKLGCVTWDGRTVFGPTAALVASGVPVSELGELVDLANFPRIEYVPHVDREQWTVPVIDIDPIGNIITSIHNARIGELPEIASVEINGKTVVAQRGDKFDDVAEQDAVFYPGSNGYLEIAINMGSAANELELFRETDLELYENGLQLVPVANLTVNKAEEGMIAQGVACRLAAA